MTATLVERDDAPDDDIEVVIMRSELGDMGPGWYVWEADFPEEGYVCFSSTKPSASDLSHL